MSQPDKSINNATHAEGFMARMWAGWRLPYIRGNDDPRAHDVPEGLSVFEGIFRSNLPDESTYILWRGDSCFALASIIPILSL